MKKVTIEPKGYLISDRSSSSVPAPLPHLPEATNSHPAHQHQIPVGGCRIRGKIDDSSPSKSEKELNFLINL